MANIKTYSKAKDGGTYLSTNFQVKEFASKDGSDSILIDLDLVNFLQQIRDWACKGITINSGYRTASHNAKVGGAKSSYHVKGQAADIVVSGKTLKEVAAYAESIGMKGILRYDTSGFVHVDTRASKYYATVSNGKTTSVGTFGGAPTNAPVGRVAEFQAWLNANYNSSLKVDNAFGPATLKAFTKAIQREIGVAADGIWGPKSKAACRALRLGDSGNLVYLLQGLLYCRGYIYAGFNGQFTENVKSEVMAYQGAKKLAKDGIAGKDTFTSLLVG